MVALTAALAVLGKGVPAVKGLYDYEMGRRRALAQKIIQKRLGKGETWAVADDATATLLIGFLRAAEDGAGAENLDLLVQVIASARQQPTLVAARFRRWRQVLADMAREEILVLGRFAVGVVECEKIPAAQRKHEPGTAGFLQAVADLVGIDRPFADQEAISTHLSALQRTGLIRINESWGGGMMPTHALFELLTFVNFEEAIKAADVAEAEASKLHL